MDFSKRLQQILDYYSLSATSFADRVAVGRSSISHLLSGRNKPSLEFVMHVLKEFPEVTLTWLVDGDGTFPATSNVLQPAPSIQQITEQKNIESSTVPPQENVSQQTADLFSQNTDVVTPPKQDFKNGKYVTKVILLYSDGTFSNYTPNDTIE